MCMSRCFGSELQLEPRTTSDLSGDHNTYTWVVYGLCTDNHVGVDASSLEYRV